MVQANGCGPHSPDIHIWDVTRLVRCRCSNVLTTSFIKSVVVKEKMAICDEALWG
ncbi:hypothetical protein ETAA8_25000 [Anatilimnocola aggregata]|uniref:Uncharacterized protein n=1 Tax=Anatilimnocola aggregata TaxID=2528021 RepID=A0A517YAZ8_9BACT|nr:hypothetical protein ETAA8_25000 [Anatilimnocola aggregata]